VLVGLSVVLVMFDGSNRLLAALAVMSIVPGLFLSIPTGALWATENLRHNVVASLGATTVNLMGVTVTLIFHWGLLGLVTSLLVSRVVDCLLRFSIFTRLYARLPGEASDQPLDLALRKRMLPFAAQQMVLTLLYALMFDRMEISFLKAMAPSREIAFFSISFTLVQYLIIFPQNLSASAGASMFVKQGRSNSEAARVAATATWFMMLVAAPELFGVASVSEPLLRLMYGSKYLPAIPVLTALALSGLNLAVSQPAQYLLVASERQTFYVIWLSLSGAIDVLGNIILIPRYGALGAAIGKGISQTIAGAGCLAYMLRNFDVRLPLARMARLLGASALMFFGVRLVGRSFKPLLGLLLGIPAGILIFTVLARLFRCLDRADGERLRKLDRLLPGRLQPGYLALVRFLVPA